MIETRTQIEKNRDKRNQRLVAMYHQLAGGEEKIAPYRIYRVIAQEFGMTNVGVKFVLEKLGVIPAKHDCNPT